MALLKIDGQTGLTSTGWDLHGINEEQWKDAGKLLTKIDKASQWWKGDWWNACPNGQGKEEAEKLGLNPGTMANFAKVCREIPKAMRNEYLSFQHHVEVCRIATEKTRIDFLHDSMEKGWTAQQLRAEIDKYKEFDDWSDTEKERKALVEEGVTVVANCNEGDDHLIQWAKDNNTYKFIGRSMHNLGWGNPYEIGKDGNREEVCDSYEHYFERKLQLNSQIRVALKGKVLGCYCYPKQCHGDFLASLVNDDIGELV